jgi:RNase P subunit RPR2
VGKREDSLVKIVGMSNIERKEPSMILKFIKQIFCNHDYTTTTGTGLFEMKRNHMPLRFYPCMKIKCKKCGKEFYHLPEVNKENKH